MTTLESTIDPSTPAFAANRAALLERLAELDAALDQARAGGGEKYVTRHHARGKLLPRERIELLLDRDSPFLELSPVAGVRHRLPGRARSVVTGIGVVEGVECLIVANDPTVRGGAVNPCIAGEDPPGRRDRPGQPAADDQPGRVAPARTCPPRRRSSSRAAGCSAT